MLRAISCLADTSITPIPHTLSPTHPSPLPLPPLPPSSYPVPLPHPSPMQCDLSSHKVDFPFPRNRTGDLTFRARQERHMVSHNSPICIQMDLTLISTTIKWKGRYVNKTSIFFSLVTQATINICVLQRCYHTEAVKRNMFTEHHSYEHNKWRVSQLSNYRWDDYYLQRHLCHYVYYYYHRRYHLFML